ncbi:MAG: site-specific integrase, partial [Sedimenticola sp.]
HITNKIWWQKPMPGSIKTTDARIDAFWVSYPQVLKKFRVPDKALPWYRKHVQTFIDRDPETRLLEQTPPCQKAPAKGLEGSVPELYRKFVAACRVPDYAISTEKSYIGWINHFLFFHLDSLPESWAEHDVASFLEHLAVKRKAAGTTQALALNTLITGNTEVRVELNIIGSSPNCVGSV